MFFNISIFLDAQIPFNFIPHWGELSTRMSHYCILFDRRIAVDEIHSHRKHFTTESESIPFNEERFWRFEFSEKISIFTFLQWNFSTYSFK